MKRDVYSIEYAIKMFEVKCPSLCVADTLISMFADKHFGCVNCVYRDTKKSRETDLAGCPYDCVGNEKVLV